MGKIAIWSSESTTYQNGSTRSQSRKATPYKHFSHVRKRSDNNDEVLLPRNNTVNRCRLWTRRKKTRRVPGSPSCPVFPAFGGRILVSPSVPWLLAASPPPSIAIKTRKRYRCTKHMRTWCNATGASRAVLVFGFVSVRDSIDPPVPNINLPAHEKRIPHAYNVSIPIAAKRRIA